MKYFFIVSIVIISLLLIGCVATNQESPAQQKNATPVQNVNFSNEANKTTVSINKDNMSRVQTGVESTSEPKPLLELQDITVSSNDNRGALFEITSTDISSTSSKPKFIGLTKGDTYAIDDKTGIKLDELSVGYTLNANWVKLSNGTDIYFIEKGNSITIAKTRIKFIEPTTDQSMIYASIRVQDGNKIEAKNLSTGDVFAASGKQVQLKNIYVGMNLDTLMIGLVTNGKIDYVSAGEKITIDEQNTSVYFDSFGFKTMANLPSQKNKKVFLDVYEKDGGFNSTLKLAIGETRQIGTASIAYLQYSAGCANDFTRECQSAELSIDGKNLVLRPGDIYNLGENFIRVADFEIPGDGTYASFILFQNGSKMYFLKKLGESFSLSNGDTAQVLDIRKGFSLGKKEVKLRIGKIERIISIGEYLCSNDEVATDESSCYSLDYRGANAHLTQDMIDKNKVLSSCSDGSIVSDSTQCPKAKPVTQQTVSSTSCTSGDGICNTQCPNLYSTCFTKCRFDQKCQKGCLQFQDTDCIACNMNKKDFICPDHCSAITDADCIAPKYEAYSKDKKIHMKILSGGCNSGVFRIDYTIYNEGDSDLHITNQNLLYYFDNNGNSRYNDNYYDETLIPGYKYSYKVYIPVCAKDGKFAFIPEGNVSNAIVFDVGES